MTTRNNKGQFTKRDDALYSLPVWSDEYTDRRSADFPFNYIPPLLANLIEDVNNPSHLERVSTDDPVAAFITHEVSKGALDDWFFFVDEHDRQINSIVTNRVMKKLKEYDFFSHFMDAADKARTFGWAILAVNGQSLMSYSPDQVNILDIDERGKPTEYEITIPNGENFTLKSEKVIHLVSEISFNHTYRMEGVSVIRPIWSDLILLRWTVYTMTEYAARVGGGFIHIKTDAESAEDLKKIRQVYAGINSRKLAISGAHILGIETAVSQALNAKYKEYVDALYERISAGSGVPKDIIIGVSAGQITGSEVNERGMFRKLEVIQKHFEKYIYEFFDLVDISIGDLRIRWFKEFKLDEQKKETVENLKIDRAMKMKMLGIFTSNQILEALGYEKNDNPEFDNVITQEMPGINLNWQEKKDE